MSPLSIVIIIMIVVLIFLLVKYLYADPYTLNGIQDGKTTSTIEASSLATNGSDVPSSNFAYSIWFYINDWNYRYGEPKVIFGRMGSKSNKENSSIPGISGLDPCPAVILGAIQNNIVVSMGCYPGNDTQPIEGGGNTVVHSCSIANIPIQKWVNLVVSVYGRTMDLYIDGKLVRTCLLPGVASINNNANVYLTPGGGFDGWTSKFQYYPNTLNPQEVWNIYSKGYQGSGSMSSSLNSYEVQVSVLQNGTTQNTITI